MRPVSPKSTGSGDLGIIIIIMGETIAITKGNPRVAVSGVRGAK
jgi:hypothetical protein